MEQLYMPTKHLDQARKQIEIIYNSLVETLTKIPVFTLLEFWDWMVLMFDKLINRLFYCIFNKLEAQLLRFWPIELIKNCVWEILSL